MQCDGLKINSLIMHTCGAFTQGAQLFLQNQTEKQRKSV